MDGQSNAPQPSDEPSWQFKPGETISPRTTTPAATPFAPEPAATPVADQPAEVPAPPAPVVSSPSQLSTPEPQPVAPAPAPLTSPAPVAPQPQPDYQPAPAPAEWPSDSVSWTASEFIAHHKTPGWHLLVVIASLLAAAVVWLLTRDLVSSIVIVFAGAILSFYGAHKPQQLQYEVDSEGLTIGQRRFSFGDFRAFSVAPEGAFSSIELVPSKRFAPLVTLYYDPADEERILGVVGSHLPEQEHKTDAVTALMRRIRF